MRSYALQVIPILNKFIYNIFMFRLDLDELATLDKLTPIFSYNKFNIFSFFDKDYLLKNNKSTKIKVIEYLSSNGLQIGRNCKIELITMPRIFRVYFLILCHFILYQKITCIAML